MRLAVERLQIDAERARTKCLWRNILGEVVKGIQPPFHFLASKHQEREVYIVAVCSSCANA
jgi:hypothetical protein